MKLKLSDLIAIVFVPWAFACWVVSCILGMFTICVVLLISKSQWAWRTGYAILDIWARFIMAFMFCRLKIYGRELYDKKRTYIYVSNHLSLLDAPIVVMSRINPCKYLAKKETGKLPVVGFILKRMHIIVDRKNDASRKKSMEVMMKSLHDGMPIWIFPEGTRNQTDKPLKDFYDGAFRLAIAAQIPIAVMTIKGSHKSLPPKPFYRMRPFKTVISRWTPAIETTGMTMNDLGTLKQKVREQMLHSLNMD